MKFIDKKWLASLLILLLFLSLVGCGKKDDSLNEDIEETDVDVVEEIEENLEGLALSPLTGLYVDEEVARRRPVAVMINNIKVALPQSGISQAEVIYETLAEGNITRLLAIFQSFDAEKIGPVRSARHYYIDLAFNHDAILLHHGGSPQALQGVKDLKADNMNTLSFLESTVTWRDPVRRQQRGMFEHSLYTNFEMIMKGWERMKYREEIKEDLPNMLLFSSEEVIPKGDQANKVIFPFTNQISTSFEYDKETGLYNRIQFNGPHIDEMNNQQLTTKNIIVQYTNIRHIQGDTAGRRDIKLVDKGEGMYISNGYAIPITWSKDSHQAPTIYRDQQGNKLEMNKGNTWIIIFPNNRQIQLD